MNVFACLSVIVLAAICQGLLFEKNECTDNSDCLASQCCVNDFRGHYCAYYQNDTDPCHRPGHHAYVYKCGCAQGLVCEHFHLHPGTVPPSDDPLSSIEGAVESAGLGFCTAAQH
ncbi:U3-aranetoxin-Ce1a-like [Ylistrum balloti]|uniref:U3-aranetoxin-Ce1a-like n=1 Tax=Ylistrum balloti TaxID=509963 RepID=UPI002905D602|nr:U3-aranetoxin-Ce1a-like [Ylistrum balloti]